MKMDGDNSSDMWSWGLRRKEVNKSWILTKDLKQIYPMNISRVSLFSWPHSWLTQLMTPPFKRISPLETQKQHSVLCVCFFLPVGVQMTGFLWQFSLCLRARHSGVSQDSSQDCFLLIFHSLLQQHSLHPFYMLTDPKGVSLRSPL